MDILLLNDVEDVGKKDEVVSVKDGYGKNFLINKGLGIQVNDEVLNKLKERLDKEKEEELKNIEIAEEFKYKLELDTFLLEKDVTPNCSLVKTVTKKDFLNLLKEKFSVYTFNKNSLNMETIRYPGFYEINYKIYKDISATIRLEVNANPID